MIGTLRTVVLDAPDTRRLAAFYTALGGWTARYADDVWITMQTGDGWRIATQLSPDHVPPRWPDPAYPQQAHLGLRVPDLDAGWAKAALLASALSYLVFWAGLAAMLEGPLATPWPRTTALVAVMLSRTPQWYFAWGGNPTALALGLSLLGAATLDRAGSREAPRTARLRAGFIEIVEARRAKQPTTFWLMSHTRRFLSLQQMSLARSGQPRPIVLRELSRPESLRFDLAFAAHQPLRHLIVDAELLVDEAQRIVRKIEALDARIERRRAGSVLIGAVRQAGFRRARGDRAQERRFRIGGLHREARVAVADRPLVVRPESQLEEVSLRLAGR